MIQKYVRHKVFYFPNLLYQLYLFAHMAKKKWLFVSKNEDEDEYDDNDYDNDDDDDEHKDDDGV